MHGAKCLALCLCAVVLSSLPRLTVIPRVTRSPGISYVLLCVVAIALPTCGWGCALLLTDATGNGRNPLMPIVPPKDAIELQVIFVDRVVGDPLIGESLWNDLHAVTVVDPAVRDRLMQHGFRFAMSPSRPPQSLQSLIALSTTDDPSKLALARNYTLIDGQEAWFMSSTLPPGTQVRIPMDDSVRAIEADQGSCWFRIRATRQSENWAKLEIVPEFRYGEVAIRPRPTDHEWLYEQGQKSVVLYEDRLGVELNVGEVLVLGLAGDDPDSLGRRYFRAEANGREFERLILIRLTEMKRIEPVRMPSEGASITVP